MLCFEIDGGDGDQSFFSHKSIACAVEAEWFPGELIRGPAILLKVSDGVFEGRYLAITSRSLLNIHESLEQSKTEGYKYLSVVVHLLNLIDGKFDPENEECADPVGMAVIAIL